MLERCADDEYGTFYPEVVRAGSLRNALQSVADREGHELAVALPSSPGWRRGGARVDADGRGASVQTALDVRCFSVDCWTGDVLMASGGTPDLTEAAGAMQSWLRAPRVRDFVAQWPFLRTWELAEAHERGDAVAVRWRQLREAVARTAGTALRELVEAAYEQEELRALSPGRGMHWLTFSRRAAPPVCRDLPAAMSLRDGRYRVRRPDGRMQDLDGVAETIAVILADLPEDVARQG